MEANVIFLEEVIQHDYEPTEEEVREFAEWLGMDLEEDNDLAWIARDALKTPLQEPWRMCQIEGTNDVFYFNVETRESVWTHPVDEHFRGVYQRAHEWKYRPRLSCTLAQGSDESGAVRAVVTSLGGNELVSISTCELSQTVGRLKRVLRKKFNVPVHLAFADGRLVTKSFDKARLYEALGVAPARPLCRRPTQQGATQQGAAQQVLTERMRQPPSALPRRGSTDEVLRYGNSASDAEGATGSLLVRRLGQRKIPLRRRARARSI